MNSTALGRIGNIAYSFTLWVIANISAILSISELHFGDTKPKSYGLLDFCRFKRAKYGVVARSGQASILGGMNGIEV